MRRKRPHPAITLARPRGYRARGTISWTSRISRSGPRYPATGISRCGGAISWLAGISRARLRYPAAARCPGCERDIPPRRDIAAIGLRYRAEVGYRAQVVGHPASSRYRGIGSRYPAVARYRGVPFVGYRAASRHRGGALRVAISCRGGISCARVWDIPPRRDIAVGRDILPRCDIAARHAWDIVLHRDIASGSCGLRYPAEAGNLALVCGISRLDAISRSGSRYPAEARYPTRRVRPATLCACRACSPAARTRIAASSLSPPLRHIPPQQDVAAPGAISRCSGMSQPQVRYPAEVRYPTRRVRPATCACRACSPAAAAHASPLASSLGPPSQTHPTSAGYRSPRCDIPLQRWCDIPPPCDIPPTLRAESARASYYI
jgi:hypothetical protein